MAKKGSVPHQFVDFDVPMPTSAAMLDSPEQKAKRAEQREQRMTEAAMERISRAPVQLYQQDVCLMKVTCGRLAKSYSHGWYIGGFFKRTGGGYTLVSGGRDARWICNCTELMRGMGAVLDWFGQENVKMILCGQLQGDVLLVREIHSTGFTSDSTDYFNAVSDIGLQQIIGRMVYNVSPGKITDEYLRSPLCSEVKELRLLYQVLKDDLTESMCQWVDQSLIKADNQYNRDERAHVRRAISYMLNINWKPTPPKLPSLEEVEARLDRGFYGMESVKRRVLEVVAHIRHTGRMPQWGLLFDGPAGTGKTTISKAIADVLGLRLVILDMSTVHDGEGLEGTSRVYSNAKPGLIAEKLLEARDSNCMILINELDKSAGGKERGNPSDVLLTLVDKLGFRDVFMETVLDTSNVFFVATCNDLDKISMPLQDRFLRIEIGGYRPQEKEELFKRYVLPKALAQSSISPLELTVGDDFVQDLCRYYAMAPGARDLEQMAERVVGDYLLRLERGGLRCKCYGADDLELLFGAKRRLQRHLAATPGVVRTLYSGSDGMRLGLVEASARPGTGKLNLVIMPSRFYEDCAKLAYEAAKNLSAVPFDDLDITVCLPVIPPASAENMIGCAVFMAIMSAVTGKAIPDTSVFLGGCDLFGNLFWDCLEVEKVTEYLERAGLTHMYGPVDIGQRATGNSAVEIVGSFNAGMLFEIA